MSSGPTGTGETCIQVTKRGRINIDLRVKDWCTYTGKCEADMATQEYTICWYCGYMKKFEIPEMIQKLKREKGLNV